MPSERFRAQNKHVGRNANSGQDRHGSSHEDAQSARHVLLPAPPSSVFPAALGNTTGLPHKTTTTAARTSSTRDHLVAPSLPAAMLCVADGVDDPVPDPVPVPELPPPPLPFVDARAQYTCELAAASWPADDRCAQVMTTGQTLPAASVHAVSLPDDVGGEPKA